MTPLGDMTVVPAVKLIDLGLSKSTVDHSAADTLLGTPYYIAPEVYAAGFAASKGAHPSKTTYDPYTADTWALGVLLLTVFRWQFPFHAREGMSLAVNGQLRDKLLEQVGEVNASPAAHDFLLRCFTLKPEDRPTPTTLLNDPWIKAGEPYPQARALSSTALGISVADCVTVSALRSFRSHAMHRWLSCRARRSSMPSSLRLKTR